MGLSSPLRDGWRVISLNPASRVGHLRFTFNAKKKNAVPNIVIQASRESILMSDTNVFIKWLHNVTYPKGGVHIDAGRREIYGWNEERQE